MFFYASIGLFSKCYIVKYICQNVDVTHKKGQPQNLHILYVIIHNYVLYTCIIQSYGETINAEMSAWAMYKKFNIISQFTKPFQNLVLIWMS